MIEYVAYGIALLWLGLGALVSIMEVLRWVIARSHGWPVPWSWRLLVPALSLGYLDKKVQDLERHGWDPYKQRFNPNA
jgi:hypothetical protein